ncbi:hypothetical protein [Thalassospira sp.]|uniref:hypothetical protein n=1 Tax=Thalassospira sp. TaxID=1912094 RepID=UPI0027328FE6|nr:hypothetical protein [Thalassospira sp.]MDP2699977.1 hypothetical protein [Thalassospira sp.]
MSLSFKIGMSLSLVLAAALALTTVLNFLRFDETLHDFLSQRMTVILSEARREMLTGLDLGLRLENLENLSDGLERHMRAADDIRAIEVLGCDGSLITGAGDVGGSYAGFVTPTTDQWEILGEADVISGAILRDSVGQCAGYVRIIANIADYRATLDRAFVNLWQAAALGMMTIVPVLLVLVILMRRRHRIFVELQTDLDRAIAGEQSGGPTHDGDALTAGERQMIGLYREVRDKLTTDHPSGNGRGTKP